MSVYDRAPTRNIRNKWNGLHLLFIFVWPRDSLCGRSRLVADGSPRTTPGDAVNSSLFGEPRTLSGFKSTKSIRFQIFSTLLYLVVLLLFGVLVRLVHYVMVDTVLPYLIQCVIKLNTWLCTFCERLKHPSCVPGISKNVKRPHRNWTVTVDCFECFTYLPSTEGIATLIPVPRIVLVFVL